MQAIRKRNNHKNNFIGDIIMSQFYTNSYEKFLYEKTEEYRKNWRDSVAEIERLSKENSDLKMTIERERQLYKLQLEQTARKLTLK